MGFSAKTILVKWGERNPDSNVLGCQKKVKGARNSLKNSGYAEGGGRQHSN